MVLPELKTEAECLLIPTTLSSEAAVWEILIGSMDLSPTLGNIFKSQAFLIWKHSSESKIMLNSVKPRAKKSKVERLMSIQIYIVFAFQIALCIFCAIWYSTWFESNDVINTWIFE